MGEYEDMVARLKDEGLDDLAAIAEKFTVSRLRDQANKADAKDEEIKVLQEEIKGLKAAPKRMAALKAAKVDVGKLKPAELEIINSQRLAEGKEYDEEWAKGLVEKYSLIVTEEAEGEGEETPPAQGMVDAAMKTGNKSGQGKAVLTAAELATWDPRDRMALMEYLDVEGLKNVEQALSRGETVTGISFTPAYKKVSVAGGVNWGPRSQPQE